MFVKMVHKYKYYVSLHYPSSHFYLKHNVSKTGFCLHLQVKRTPLGPIDRASPYLRTPAPIQDRVYRPSKAQTICKSWDKTLKTSHLWGLAPEYYPNRSHHWRDKFFIWYQHKKHKIFPLNLQRKSCSCGSFFFFCCHEWSPGCVD
jgi:hypothetical protein